MKTLYDEVNDLVKALKGFFGIVVDELGLIRFMDWLENKLTGNK